MAPVKVSGRASNSAFGHELPYALQKSRLMQPNRWWRGLRKVPNSAVSADATEVIEHVRKPRMPYLPSYIRSSSAWSEDGRRRIAAVYRAISTADRMIRIV